MGGTDPGPATGNPVCTQAADKPGGAAMLALLSCHQPEKCLPTGWAEEKRGYPLGSSAGLGSGGNDCRRRQDLVGEKVPAVPGGMRKKWKK